MNITQNEYNITKQSTRTIYAKINLLNYQFQTVDELNAVVLDGSSYTISPTSDIRRTCSLQLHPIDSSFDIAEGNKIWLDKYLQIYIGIEDIRTKEIVYTNMGIYIINNPSRAFSATSDVLTIEGLDLVAKLTGLRNGYLDGFTYMVSADENIRTAIIETLALAGFTKYVVDECEYPTVPNDITVDIGGTVWDILTQLRDIIPSYQMYFDVDGVFHYDKIPTGDNEQIMVDDDIWQEVLLSYNQNVDFSNLKNSIEVIGKTWDLGSNYLGTATFASNVYTVSSVNDISNGSVIGFTTENASSSPKITITSKVTKIPVYTDDTLTKTAVFDNTETYRVFKYVEEDDNTYFIYYGEVTPYAIAEETNPSSPYYIDGNLGKIRIVLSGGDYDNITNINLAQERADWERYTRCRLLDSISITCVPIYWLDTNLVAQLTLPKQETETYIIKDITTTMGISGTQTVSLMKYYPEIEPVVEYNVEFLDSIEGIGTNYFDTGLQVAVPTHEIEFKATVTNGILSTYCGISPDYTNLLFTGTNTFRLDWNGTRSDYASGTFTPNDNITVVANSGGVTINGDNYPISILKTKATIHSFPILGQFDGNKNVTNIASTKMYYFKIKADSQLVADYIPVRFLDTGLVTLYDYVTHKYLIPQGTGSFIGHSKSIPEYANVEVWEDENTTLLLKSINGEIVDISQNKYVVTNNSAVVNEQGFTLGSSSGWLRTDTNCFNGSGDWCIEFIENCNSDTNATGGIVWVMPTSSYSTFGGLLVGYHTTWAYASTITNSWNILSSYDCKTRTTGVNVEWCFQRRGNLFEVYKDGIKTHTTAFASNILQASDGYFNIGNYANQIVYNADILEFKVSNIARYDSDYTPNSDNYLY